MGEGEVLGTLGGIKRSPFALFKAGWLVTALGAEQGIM